MFALFRNAARPVSLLVLTAAAIAAPLALPSAASPAQAQAQSSRAPAPALTGDLLRVQQHLTAMTSMTADFVQTDRRGQTMPGRLTIQQPGRIRFQYDPGIPLLIVADGRSLTLIDYEVNQVQRWPIRNSPLSVLIDPSANLVRYGRLVPTGNANTISVEVRDPARPEYGTITLILMRDAAAPAGLRLFSWVAVDAQRNRTTVRLTNQRYNVPIAANAFRWRDPRTTNRPR